MREEFTTALVAPRTAALPSTGGKALAVFGVVPRFLSPDAAGKYLGHSSEWLRRLAKIHDFFKPTIRGQGKGSPCYYSIDHLDRIAEYMEDEPGFLEDAKLMDEALLLFTRSRRNRRQRRFEEAKQ